MWSLPSSVRRQFIAEALYAPRLRYFSNYTLQKNLMFKLDNFHIVNFHLALSSHGWAEREPSENLQFKNDKTLRYYLGIFPQRGGGGLPQTFVLNKYLDFFLLTEFCRPSSDPRLEKNVKTLHCSGLCLGNLCIFRIPCGIFFRHVLENFGQI